MRPQDEHRRSTAEDIKGLIFEKALDRFATYGFGKTTLVEIARDWKDSSAVPVGPLGRTPLMKKSYNFRNPGYSMKQQTYEFSELGEE